MDMTDDPYEICVPSVDGCAICGDCECDGISCIKDLDADDEGDHPEIEQLQAWVRAGRVWHCAERALAVAENRKPLAR
jgi:hypothetical protein